MQWYTRPDLFLWHSPHTKPRSPFDVVVAGKSLRVCTWPGVLKVVDSIAQEGCIWKLQALHLKANPLMGLLQISHFDFELPPFTKMKNIKQKINIVSIKINLVWPNFIAIVIKSLVVQLVITSWYIYIYFLIYKYKSFVSFFILTWFRIERKLVVGVERVALERIRSSGTKLMELKFTLLASEPHACTKLLAARTGEEVRQVNSRQRMLWVTEMMYLLPKD